MMQNGHISTNGYNKLIAVTRAVEIDSPDAFLRVLDGQPRVFWQRGQYASAFAGAGMAMDVSATGRERFTAIRRAINEVYGRAIIDTDAPDEVRLRWFGGFSFTPPGNDDPLWAAFGAARFILPRYLLTRVGGFHWLTICDYGTGDPEARLNALRAEIAHLTAQMANSPTPAPARELLPDAVIERTDRSTWMSQVEHAVGLIHAGKLRKVVLARALEMDFSSRVNTLAALAELERSYPTAYRFLFEPEPGAAFFGATPELLVRLEGGELFTNALAGSAARGATPEADDRLAAELLASPKDRHEHALVVDWLRATLTPITRALMVGTEPQVVKLKNIQHLYTPVRATLKTSAHVLQFVERMHPTPALGGDPQAAAVATIAEIEPLARGWYGAPVGWMDGEGGGEFAVAIRSAVALGERVRLYAGAGIVGDSVPAKEWDETALKFKPLLGALGLANAGAQSSVLGAQSARGVLSSDF